MTWTTPTDLRQQLQRLWDRGAILQARVTRERLFPRRLRLRRPSSGELAQHFGAVQDWVRALRKGAKEQRGFGYTIEWRQVEHRVHGTNHLPWAVTVETEADGLRLLGKARDAERFGLLIADTLDRFPELRPWLARRSLAVLELADDWPALLATAQWFREHPRPGLYLRQLDIPGVHTKFIEEHRGVLSEILDLVLPEGAIDSSAKGLRAFEPRYGLRRKAPLLRFRVLDPALAIRGLTDLSVPPEQFASLELPVEQVFVTENEINGLAFPEVAGSLVIFGLGYGAERLGAVPWLHRTVVHYWGDLDTHGFAILSRLRSNLPGARSFLMDRMTLDAHRRLWGQEPVDSRYLGDLSALTGPEQAVFMALRENLVGERVRLEQERIPFAWVVQAVSAATAPAGRRE